MMTAGERKRHRVRGEWASRMHGSSGAGRASSTLRFLPRRPGTCAFWRRPGTRICAPLQQLLASTRLDSPVLGSCGCWRGGALVRSYRQGVCCISRNSAAGSGNACPTSTRSEVEFCSCRGDVCVCLPALTCCERLAARARAASRFSSILPWHAGLSRRHSAVHARRVQFCSCVHACSARATEFSRL